jgi:hypothetical protein
MARMLAAPAFRIPLIPETPLSPESLGTAVTGPASCSGVGNVTGVLSSSQRPIQPQPERPEQASMPVRTWTWQRISSRTGSTVGGW